MDAPEIHHESKDFDELGHCRRMLSVFSAVRSLAHQFSAVRSLAHQRDQLFSTWFTLATLFAVLAACVSITSPVRSQTKVNWSLTPISIEVEIAETTSAGSPSDASLLLHAHPKHHSHDDQALESEFDDRDVDFEAQTVGPFALALVPALRVLQQAQYTGSLITPAHLRISSDLPRGPPVFS